MGIKTINNFDPQFSDSLDRRLVVADIAGRDALVTDEVVYEGIVVYVKDNGADKAEFYTYVNVGTVVIPVLEWIVFGTGGGGVSVHNDLTGIQGGISNTEHFHLNESQYDWVVDSTPFNAPGATLSTNVGPTWNYDAEISQPVILSGSIIQNQGISVKTRMLDPSGFPLDLDGNEDDSNGWVDVIGSKVIVYTFPDVANPNKSVPVNTLSVTGDSAQYKLQVEYIDDGGITRTTTRTLTYVSKARNINEVWYNTFGNIPLPNPATPSTIPPLGVVVVLPPEPQSGLPSVVNSAQASAGILFDLRTNSQAYVVFVISKDIVSSPQEVRIHQGSFTIYYPGTDDNNEWTYLDPYPGNTAASQGNDFFMMYSVVKLGGEQKFELEFIPDSGAVLS